jgi:hypothetical protein
MAERELTYSSPTPRAVLRPLKQPLYDTENMPSAGLAQIIFFQRPLGQNLGAAPVAAKSYADTNMQQASQLGTPQEFDLYGFNMRLGVPVTLVDFQLLMDQGLFVFNFGQGRPWLRCQLGDIPTGCGQNGAASIDGAVAQVLHDIPVQGVPSTKEFYNFCVGKKPIRIRSNETFNVEIDYPNGVPNIAAAFCRMTVLMRGILYTSL